MEGEQLKMEGDNIHRAVKRGFFYNYKIINPRLIIDWLPHDYHYPVLCKIIITT